MHPLSRSLVCFSFRWNNNNKNNNTNNNLSLSLTVKSEMRKKHTALKQYADLDLEKVI